ncbi:MAG: hypothetical protein F9K29_03645 [Hyphomicrobiaceae bacterium]|nr:MAG: hypothetical protein F9K29_03645 [Hyphomicrobiaceae bacterium]
MPRPRKRKTKLIQPPAYSLPDIERLALSDGNEVLFGTRKVKIVRTVIAYEPCPEAGPGMWREAYVDEIVEAPPLAPQRFARAALEAARDRDMTASMFRALSAANFEAIERLRERVHGSDAYET